MQLSGFEVYTAQNGLEALEIVLDNSMDFFSAIILDINMPVMDGYEACNSIYDYLTQDFVRLPNERPNRELENRARPEKTMIYCLTGDLSPETDTLIS